MAYSLQQVVSDGSLNRITVSIDYIDKVNISVFVDDVVLPDGTYTWAWDGEDVVITPNVANASVVTVKRNTKFDLPYHDFSAGAVFKDSSIDENFRQMLFIAQEAAEGATATDFYQDLNFHGYRLTKVGNAVEDDDAVPFAQYRADALGAFQQRVLAQTAATTAVASQSAAAASQSAAASSASSAASSASSASTSASSANTSATNASAFASSASTSATNAAASAAAAAAAAASVDITTLVHKDSATGAAVLPVGTTAQRPANGAGKIRFNSDLGRFEGNNGSAWGSMGGAQVQLGDSVTAANNFVLTSAANDGTMKLARGNYGATTQDIVAVDTSGVVDHPQGLKIAGTSGQRMMLTASQTSTSGTAIDFTGIPSWAKRITVQFAGLSTNGSSIVLIRLGTSSGVEETGYNGSVYSAAASAGLCQLITVGLALHRSAMGAASVARNGAATFTLVGSNSWAGTQVNGHHDTAVVSMGGCAKALSGTLDRIRITTVNGTDTFDTGSVSLLIEGY